ncbi:FkbM family methyltransferase [Iningainema tapete]|uniref:FkbM family methyltransferase n=1 Tax=Iningainema tapete BLCC-T55 TaxID=2748662 RepID=A0A8J6XSS8_9CYAN|nr:FkbM family methyltransferase [Iningainema tapete]MBD2777694.1 FkbM family methyltransferase [Iningainema tapete BLCC-T55]
MQITLAETVLPNGMKIFCLQKKLVPIIYQQVQEYLKNGIELQKGDTVFDIGANIGLFSLYLYQLYHKNVSIYAFEPIPAIFEVLHRNAQRFDPETIKVFCCGLSQESKTLNFGYYPNAPVLSTAYPEDSKEVRDRLKKTTLDNLKDLPSAFRWISWLPPFLRSLILDRILEKAFQQEQVTCQVKTVSEIIREHDIQRIDLLKVDVEKSELDVLLGIEEQDWLKIKQIVVEVHDLDHRVEKITSLLKKNRFNEMKVEQEQARKGTNVFNIYAVQ